MHARTAIMYLSWNSVAYFPDVLKSWEALEDKESVEIYLVDNASTDGSQDWIREHIVPKSGISIPKLHFIANETNDGFAEGNNIAIRQALDTGFDYMYLQNNDLRLAPSTIKEAVSLAESNAAIGSVQSLMLLWQDEETVNSTGGMVHFLGFGFVRDNGKKRSAIDVKDGEEIAYGSGAATLYRASVLREVGLLDPYYFMYHEDLELGWRIRLAGYKNCLSAKSIAFHKYEFSRSVKKLYWMETNRWLVHLGHLSAFSLVLILPFMLLMEFALFFFALKGGWMAQKLKAWSQALRPSTWQHIAKKRRESAVIRKVRDAEIVKHWTAKIEHQETSSPLVEKIGNPALEAIWSVLKKLIR